MHPRRPGTPGVQGLQHQLGPQARSANTNVHHIAKLRPGPNLPCHGQHAAQPLVAFHVSRLGGRRRLPLRLSVGCAQAHMQGGALLRHVDHRTGIQGVASAGHAGRIGQLQQCVQRRPVPQVLGKIHQYMRCLQAEVCKTPRLPQGLLQIHALPTRQGLCLKHLPD